MHQRLDYAAIAPDGYKAFGRVHQYVATCGLEESLINLVYLRVSQINGCAYCVDTHTRDALKAGEDNRRLHNLITWREAPFFTERERAALTWAESLTLIALTHAPDADYEIVRRQFSEKEIVDLTYAVGLMNALNRLAIGVRRGPAA